MVEDGILHVIFHMVAKEWLSVPDHLSLLNVDRFVLADLDLSRQLIYLRLYREDIAEAERFEEETRRVAAEVRQAQRRTERRAFRRWSIDLGLPAADGSSDDWSLGGD